MINGTPIKCPICKKKFYAELGGWAWKIGWKSETRYVCSYACMRTWQKKKENSPRALRKAAKIEKELRGELVGRTQSLA